MKEPRQIRIEGDVAYIPLTKGHEAVIDAADVPLVKDMWWCAVTQRRKKVVYAVSRYMHTVLYLHRVIMRAPVDMKVDHIDINGLNNRRSNLRFATSSQNQCNRVMLKNISGKKGGVSRNGLGWKACIGIDNVDKYLGTFATIDEAAAAYDAAALELHGEFARTNEMQQCAA